MKPAAFFAASVALGAACCGTASAPAGNARPVVWPSASAAAPVATVNAIAVASSAVLAAAPRALDVTFTREVEGPIVAMAIEKPPHVVALGTDRLWTHDDRGWHSDALPSDVAHEIGSGNGSSFSIFFGRDYRARIVGSIGGTDGRLVYLRYRDGRVSSERRELGQLGASDHPIVAVLGTSDPEILCGSGDACLLKSVRGWKTIAAPEGLSRVALGEGTGWAVAGRQLWRLGDAWEAAGNDAPWTTADALVGVRDGAWVIESTTDRLHLFDGAKWHSIDSPLARPRAMWSPDDHRWFVVGDGGMATYEGGVEVPRPPTDNPAAAWRLASAAPHPLGSVVGRSGGELYVGGPGGVFRVVESPSGR